MNRKLSLETQKKDLEEKIDTITTQMGFLDPASMEYKDFKRRNVVYFSELETIETELSELPKSSLTNHQRGNLFEKKLPNIDFAKPKTKIKNILDKFGRDGGSAFFMIENIRSNKGDLLIRHIHHSLSDIDNNIKHCQINLFSNFIKNEETLLDAMAKFIPNAKKDENIDNYASNIIDEIEGNLQPGSIILFEFHCWEALGENQNDLLSWFIQNFWIPLTKKQEEISKNYANIKILIFITTDSSLSKEIKNLPYFCNQAQFYHQNFLKLSLQKKWGQQEIIKWIEDTYKYSRQTSEEESEKILSLSKGDPSYICDLLQKRFNKIA